eukprot:s1403_g26.t1
MYSNTLIVRTVALVSIFTGWLSPRDRLVLDARVQRLELIVHMFRQVLSRIGVPLNVQGLRFVWGSAVQSLWLLESAFFPEQETQTDTTLTTPNGDPLSFSALVSDPSFRPYVDLLRPTFVALQEFYTYLDSNYTREDHADIFHAITDSIWVIQNISLAFQFDVRRNQNLAPAAAADPAPAPVFEDAPGRLVEDEDVPEAIPAPGAPADTGGP